MSASGPYLCMQYLSPSGKQWEKTSAHAILYEPEELCFFCFLWHIILLCLTWSLLTVSLLLVSFGSGSYSNPFLHASNRLILSLLSCCSTWQRIMLGTPFAFQVIHNVCTFTNFYKNPIKNQTILAASLLSDWQKIKFRLTCCQHLSARWPLSPPCSCNSLISCHNAIEICLYFSFSTLEWPHWYCTQTQNWQKLCLSCTAFDEPTALCFGRNSNTTKSVLRHLSSLQDFSRCFGQCCFKNVVAFCTRAAKFGLKVGHPYPQSSKQSRGWWVESFPARALASTLLDKRERRRRKALASCEVWDVCQTNGRLGV